MFNSNFRVSGVVELPEFTGIRVMMMPLVLGDVSWVPDSIKAYKPVLESLYALCGHKGEVGYLTVDEKEVLPGKTHRRAGLHVDGIYQGQCGGWGGGGGGGWASVGNGMYTVSSHAGCRAWKQSFEGWPGSEGEADHLKPQLADEGAVFLPGVVYWVDGLCVHESLPMDAPVKRQFVRLSMPSVAPWFEGYTENPLGVVPTGPVLTRREFMDVA